LDNVLSSTECSEEFVTKEVNKTYASMRNDCREAVPELLKNVKAN
jgi:hypothetical protein